MSENKEQEITKFLLIEHSDENVPYICEFVLNYATSIDSVQYIDGSQEVKVWSDYLIPVTSKFLSVISERPSGGKEIDTGLLPLASELSDVAMDSYSAPRSFLIRAFSKNRNNKRLHFLKRRYLEEISKMAFGLKSLVSTQRTENNRFFDFYGFYAPDLSNKIVAVDLLLEAISLVERDDSISDSAKRKIISNIRDIISKIESNNTKWTEVFGAIKETVIVLGAAGSIAGGAVALSQAAEKLKEAEVAVSESSINRNYLIENRAENLFKSPDLTLGYTGRLNLSLSERIEEERLP